ncbi:MAG TPA: HlyD family efflux transporter periplasmic adaptor subunit [Gemmatimonadaceae bacterium]|nr:HlyD family efflux transporter periplasmic adaptor subunit [Gemmatimonadaceae bacterium]
MVDLARAPKPKTGKYVLYGVGALAVIIVTILLSRLKPAAPTVERSIVSIDSVRQGDMVREVRGPGTLVPEYVRQVTTLASARIDHIVAEVGQHVEPGTVLLEMSNPDVDIAAMTAEQQFNDAKVNLVNTRVSLQSGILAQETAVASAKTAEVTASQQVTEAEGLLQKKLISQFEYNTRKAAAEEAATRYRVAQRQLELQRATIDSQIAAQEQNVDRLKQIAAFRETVKSSLTLRAGDSGVLQELAAGAGGTRLEPGQYVNAGQTVAKVVQPGKLLARIRIPETQAKDVAVGQPATVDTRNGIVDGRVSRIDPAPQGGTITVDISLTGALPAGARPDLNVDGTIQIQKLTNVIYTGRPAYGQDGATVGMFRLDDDGKGASRVQVRLGVSSVNAVQILAGLKPGDKVILSDMTQWDNAERVRIK